MFISFVPWIFSFNAQLHFDLVLLQAYLQGQLLFTDLKMFIPQEVKISELNHLDAQ